MGPYLLRHLSVWSLTNMAHHPFTWMGSEGTNLVVHGTVPPALFDCCPVANHNASSFHRMGWESSAAWTVQLPFSLVLGRVLLLWILKGRNVSLSFDGIIIPPLPHFVKHFSAFFVKTFYRFDCAERFPFSP